MKLFHCKALLVINCFLNILAERDFHGIVINGVSSFCGQKRVHHSLINPIGDFNTNKSALFLYFKNDLYLYFNC